MKKLFTLLILICIAPHLSGCTSLCATRSDVEDLLVMDTLGLDSLSDGVVVSLASASKCGEDECSSSPVRMSAAGSSVSAAIERMYAHSTGMELYCAHLAHVLIGEDSARDGIELFLAYICGSPQLRLDIPVFIVRGETAETAVKCAGDDSKGIAELLGASQNNLDGRSGGRIFPASEVLRDIERYGGALICAVECPPTEPGGSVRDGCSIELSGYAVMRGCSLCAFIDYEDSLGVDFLKNCVEARDLPIETQSSGTVTMEIDDGKASVTPLWGEDGALTGLDVRASVSASVLELDDIELRTDEDALTVLLEDTVARQICASLALSQQLGVDYLGLAGYVDAADPYRFRALQESFPQVLPGLDISVTVSGELSHSNDVKGT